MQCLASSLLLLLLATSASGQGLLINGSFENEEGGSWDGWTSTCATVYLVTNAAPGSGSWAALLRSDNTPPCNSHRLYQPLPEVVNGELLTLSGWVRNNNGAPVTGAFMGLGTVSHGVLETLTEVGTQDYPWVYLTVNWSAALASGDTAAVILSPGDLPAEGSFSEAAFDGMSLTYSVGIAELERPVLRIFHQGDRLYAASNTQHVIREAHLLDAQGRLVRRLAGGSTTIEVDTHALGKGLYALVAHGAFGSAIKAFVCD